MRYFPSPTTNSYPQLNVLKLFCAFFVITIHVPSVIIPQYIIELISRLAVPIFFMITGFFISESGTIITSARCKKMCLKALVFTVLAQGLYLFVDLCGDLLSNNDIYWIYNLSFWRNLILIGVSVNVPFWYLNALVQTLFVFWMLSHFKAQKIIPLLIISGLFINLFLGQYSWLIDRHFVSFIHRNFFTIGIPCVGIGFLVRKFEYSLPTTRVLTLLVSVLTVLCSLEIAFLFDAGILNGGDIYLMTIFLSCAIFCLVLSLKSKAGILSYLGMKYSGLIFVFHMLVHESLSRFIPNYSLSGPFVVFVFSLIIAALFMGLKSVLSVHYK
ncbi:hypothetical protein EEL40_10475 [Muribaculaceae bacterium Isolate-083 (Janvier)]|nr:hypothetical protein EEL37_13080 [Muribaculaceae bacterium Isolate-077 (Janvier)]ROS95906.1 hypothetical protein EEL40_10475 [Muribaculaceae bacterium Isolate-083 (Janvier)]ROS97008.1 hypothetical protein EEL41_12995 [Muribaculaceae bacterium Isolate-084 (Janvier)]